MRVREKPRPHQHGEPWEDATLDDDMPLEQLLDDPFAIEVATFVQD